MRAGALARWGLLGGGGAVLAAAIVATAVHAESPEGPPDRSVLWQGSDEAHDDRADDEGDASSTEPRGDAEAPAAPDDDDAGPEPDPDEAASDGPRDGDAGTTEPERDEGRAAAERSEGSAERGGGSETPPDEEEAGGYGSAVYAAREPAYAPPEGGWEHGDPWTLAGQRAREQAGLGREHTPSPAIFPKQEIPLRFSHQHHLALGVMDCTYCHEDAPDSDESADVNLPDEEVCLDCHTVVEPAADGGRPEPSCDSCHPGYEPDIPENLDPRATKRVPTHPPAVRIRPPRLKFSHRVHTEQDVDCERCHDGVDDLRFATRANALPVMGTCLDCHDGEQASDECSTCHLTRPDGRIAVEAGSTPLKPSGWYRNDAHDEDFVRTHAMPARRDRGYCQECHTPKECIDCHNGVTKPLRIHPNNYVLTHPIDARKSDPECTSCHRAQSFCVDCHRDAGVTWEPEGKGANALKRQGIRFHPEGWVRFGERGPNHHSFHAQRNMRACASCHTEATCLKCHSTREIGGDFGVNPHPAGFARHCADRLRRNQRTCLKCHERGSPTLRRCR